ncbi:MAG: NADH-quinone oxidoreductase subunit C [Gammaproteobacteria bacterium]|jgi:NADH-quinone oxidoreductase subunit C|nr:NADH-quinone oxidoreductase subunit C [Gammaproteobacteria bacterium]
MVDSLAAVAAHAKEKFGASIVNIIEARSELTLEVKRERLREVCRILRDDPVFSFEQLIDLCGVDYQDYRAEAPDGPRSGPRFAVTIHLLSIKHNRRVRVRAFLDNEWPRVDSVVDIWAVANWFEREAFDLFGFVFEGHPDLRRILTDYGFIGHPFRKDFPLIGEVEMRYDAEKQRVIYEPVSIEPRTLVPRVIREEGFGGRNP